MLCHVRQLAELLLFLSLAGVIHLALVPMLRFDGLEDAGEGGEESISLIASTAHVEALIAQWEAPPEQEMPQQDVVVQEEAPPEPKSLQLDEAIPERKEEPAIDQNIAPISEQEPILEPDSAFASEPESKRTALPKSQRNEQPEAQLVLTSEPIRPMLKDDYPILSETKPRAALEPEEMTGMAFKPTLKPMVFYNPLEPEPSQLSQQAKHAAQQNTQPFKSQSLKSQFLKSEPQKAKGQGGKVAAGNNKSVKQASSNPGKASKAKARWGTAIRQSIERRKRYPRGARTRGKVRLSLKVSSAGQLVAVTLARSSGSSKLDAAALSAVRRASIPQAPKGVTKGTHRFTLTISFKR